VVAVAAGGTGTIIERRFDNFGQSAGETRISFSWR
jgi:hypothetical protein